MTIVATLSHRNQAFAENRFQDGLEMMPTLKTMIVGSVDPRDDPTLVLGLELGEAVVIRNIAGRITPAIARLTGSTSSSQPSRPVCATSRRSSGQCCSTAPRTASG